MKSLRIPDQKINNAYLLTGEDAELLEGAALQFAESLFLRSAETEAERERLRLRLRSFSHPDLLRIFPDKPEENPRIISVDCIRRALADTAGIRPYEAEYKIYLVYSAEKMNQQAQNALLKTLEEPPEYTVIILMAEHADAFLPTIMSRVLMLKAGEREVRESFLALYRESWAQETARLLSEIRLRSAGDILEYIKKRTEEKLPLSSFLSFIEIILRDVLCYKSTRKTELLFCTELTDCIMKLASELGYERLGALTEELERARRGLAVNVNPELQMEMLLLLMKK